MGGMLAGCNPSRDLQPAIWMTLLRPDVYKIMYEIGAVGRFLFVVALAAFGVQHFMYALIGAGMGPPWTPASVWWVIWLGRC